MHQIFHSNQIIILGLILLGGFWAGKVIQLLKLPAVTGYVLGGIFMGFSVMNIIQKPMIHHLQFIEVLGLSMVALIIGGDLNNKKLKSLGKSVVIINLVEGSGAFFLVTLSTWLILRVPLHTALLLGAISFATAPAATIAVLQEYKAHGPLPDTLIAVVGLDDAVCVIFFSVAMAISGVLLQGSFKDFTMAHLSKPLWEIFGSIFFGVVLGFGVNKILRKIREKQEIVVVLLGFAFLAGEVAEFFGLSCLLLNMTYGYIITNFGPRPHIIDHLQDVELPILICFFTLAGATLDLPILMKNWSIALVFILARGIGKVGGAYLGGKLSHAQDTVTKYLGLALLPQAGVAIALVLAVSDSYPEIAPLVMAIILASVAFNEIFGPIGTKYAIMASGEDHRPKPKILA